MERKMPWEYQKYYDSQPYKARGWNGETFTRGICETKFEYLNDNQIMVFRKGDIVQFNDGLIKKSYSNWKSWFLTEEDLIKSYPKHPNTPYYVRNQYGLVIGRFRKIKFKYRIVYDYGVVIMMLSGDRIGYYRRYWSQHFPFKVVAPFGCKKEIYKNFTRKINSNILKVLRKTYDNTNEGRDLLVSKLYYMFNGIEKEKR